MQNLTVLKFGGSSLAAPEQIRQVARKISELHKAGRKLIVVTSAMGKTTDELTALAYKVSAQPNRRELDMLLSTGERVSMSLMSMALIDLNCPSISFTGSQAGIFTDGAFSNAQIKEIKPIRVEQALNENKIVVLAGFQGVDPVTKEITTLGRGGSDTTAVAMAAQLKADRCEILKDVDGVCSADPKIVPQAQIIKQLPVDKLYDMCFWGAKVLNYRSVKWASDHNVHMFVGRSDNFSIGTEITARTDKLAPNAATQNLLAVNSHENVYELSVSCADELEGIQSLNQIFIENQLPEPQILKCHFAPDKGTLITLITATPDVLNAAKYLLNYSAKIKLVRDQISTVTATYMSTPSQTQIVSHAERIQFIRRFFES